MNTQSSPASDGRFVPPSAAQVAAAERWVGEFARKWRTPAPDNLADLMHADTQNLIPPMVKPGNRQEVIDHFKGVLKLLPEFKLEVIRWAPTGDAVMIEWEASTRIKEKLLRWRGVDRVRLRDGKTFEGEVFWDTRRVAELVAVAAQGGQS